MIANILPQAPELLPSVHLHECKTAAGNTPAQTLSAGEQGVLSFRFIESQRSFLSRAANRESLSRAIGQPMKALKAQDS
jgi:hypothetical protein